MAHKFICKLGIIMRLGMLVNFDNNGIRIALIAFTPKRAIGNRTLDQRFGHLKSPPISTCPRCVHAMHITA